MNEHLWQTHIYFIKYFTKWTKRNWGASSQDSKLLLIDLTANLQGKSHLQPFTKSIRTLSIRFKIRVQVVNETIRLSLEHSSENRESLISYSLTRLARVLSNIASKQNNHLTFGYQDKILWHRIQLHRMPVEGISCRISLRRGHYSPKRLHWWSKKWIWILNSTNSHFAATIPPIVKIRWHQTIRREPRKCWTVNSILNTTSQNPNKTSL